MPDYNLYLLDANDHIRKRIDLVCDDDAQAIALAPDHGLIHGAELWARARRVQIFPAQGLLRTGVAGGAESVPTG